MKPLKLVLPFTISLCIFSWNTASADDYMEQIEKEAHSVHVDRATDYRAKKQQNELHYFQYNSPVEIPGNLSQTEFQVYLMDNEYELYTEYLELDTQHRKTVYDKYRKMKKPDIRILSKLMTPAGK